MIERLLSLKPRFLAFPRIWLQQVLFWGGAIVIALAAILFAKMSTYGNGLFAAIIKTHFYLSFLITPAGFALVVWMTRRVFSGAEGSGIPQAIVAIDEPEIAERASVLSLRVAAGKILLTTLGLCVGASVGREGPTVQIGASVMHALGKWLRLPSPNVRRALILAGGAAGIAAAFNTPLAGIIFAIEELSRSFEERTSGTAITTVVVAGIVSMGVLGNYSYFGHTSVALGLEQAWRPVLICGIAGGLLGGSFARLLIVVSQGIPGRIGDFIMRRPVLFAAICGFLLAVVGQLCNDSIFGTGYEEAKGLIEGTHQLPGSYGLMKLLATAVSYISGLPGGLFAPSLAVGAGLGSNIAMWMPEVPAAAVIILGMVGYFTGVVQVPITATIIVMEMIDSQSLTLPLMATAFIAFAVSRLVCPSPLYRSLAQSFLEHKTRHATRVEEERRVSS
jgi:H+/Cl- antiporter ClcA